MTDAEALEFIQNQFLVVKWPAKIYTQKEKADLHYNLARCRLWVASKLTNLRRP